MGLMLPRVPVGTYVALRALEYDHYGLGFPHARKGRVFAANVGEKRPPMPPRGIEKERKVINIDALLVDPDQRPQGVPFDERMYFFRPRFYKMLWEIHVVRLVLDPKGLDSASEGREKRP